MSLACLIGIDQGSSATKAVVLSTAGQILFNTRKDIPPPFRDGLRIEQDPRQILTSVRAVLDECIQQVRSSNVSVIGIGLSCQRSSCLVWNESTGDPRSPLLSWRDTRGLDFIRQLADHEPMIFRTTGLPLTPYYSASKFRWMRDNLVSGITGDVIFGTLSSFLVQQLTGSKQGLIDHTNAARTQLMSIHTLSWDNDLLDVFGLSGIRLPVIQPTAHEYGMVQTAAGAIPLLASLGDQQAAMLGLGVLAKGAGGINFGTGGFLMVNTGGTLVPAPGLMASVYYSNDREQRYLLEGSVNAVGDALEWVRSRLGLFKEYSEVDDLCWKAATHVTAFMGLNGIGAPHWEAEMASSFHGLETESTSADMVRAVVEGIAFFIKDIAEAMQTAGVEPDSLILSGGLSSLSYLVQIQADILGKNISVSTAREASALGAALLAGMQHGTWTAEDITRTMMPQGDPVKGEANPGLTKRYYQWKELHRMTRELNKL
jgi:glycerol kinase